MTDADITPDAHHLAIQYAPISDIQPYDNNPRYNDDAVDAVATSIQEFGFRQPIVVDENLVIIVGHTRYKAALKLGLATVPIHIAQGLTPEQAQAYRLADNQTANLSFWDKSKLAIELEQLKALDFDLSLTGFTDDELLKYVKADAIGGLSDPDEAPEPLAEATTQPGDLYILGDHRLLCGDSGSTADLDRLLGGAEIHLVNTDPPYNVTASSGSAASVAAGTNGYNGRVRPKKVKKGPAPKLTARDKPLVKTSDQEYAGQLNAWFGNIARALSPGRTFYIYGGYLNLGDYQQALAANALHYSQAIVWDKGSPVLTGNDFMQCYELVFYGWKPGAAHEFFGPINATNLWAVKKVGSQSKVHVTEKPVELAVRAMQYSSRPGENVLDLFGGSGSTLIAAQQLGRQAFLMEMDPIYCDVIVKRWEHFTGETATLDRPSEVGKELAGV